MPEGNTLQIAVLSFSILGVLILLMGVLFFSRWMSFHDTCLSPYTKTPLRRASTLSYSAMVKTLRYLYELGQYDNKIFLFRKASFCRETERIFQDSITWYDAVRVDWNFLSKRYPGNWVSWGSLADDQKAEIYYLHGSLEGFQVEFSSRNPSPRYIEPEFVEMKPGPLYVDLDTKILLGWKLVPDSEIEVLIVQKPMPKPILPNINLLKTYTT